MPAFPAKQPGRKTCERDGAKLNGASKPLSYTKRKYATLDFEENLRIQYSGTNGGLAAYRD